MSGDYISREAAISEACAGCSIDFPCEPCEPQDCEIKARLEAIPAADVVEVRHGRWEIRNWGFDYYCCSACGFEHRYEGPFAYCPNCGAKMDGGQDDV